MGDFNGIGPEIILRAVLTPSVRRICTPVLVGSMDVFEYYARRLHLSVSLREIEENLAQRERHGASAVDVLHLRPFERPRVEPGVVSAEAGRYAGEALETAARRCLRGGADALVTAPISKQAMYAAGFRSTGHTEMLSALCKTRKLAMILVAGDFRVGLTTVHEPLRLVNSFITESLVLEKIGVLHNSMKRDFGIRSPRIAILGINPHAGENGLIGEEEKQYIMPAIRTARSKRMDVAGPFPADGFFGRGTQRHFDAVLAMYHDQGLIPLKMSGFHKSVNFTAGLPIVRTSPGHGTAFEIAGKDLADASSMIEAIKLAVMIAKNRRGKLQTGA
jgi:4-hydroxythreonine-4-phosphate dehydrogenase